MHHPPRYDLHGDFLLDNPLDWATHVTHRRRRKAADLHVSSGRRLDAFEPVLQTLLLFLDVLRQVCLIGNDRCCLDL